MKSFRQQGRNAFVVVVAVLKAEKTVIFFFILNQKFKWELSTKHYDT